MGPLKKVMNEKASVGVSGMKVVYIIHSQRAHIRQHPNSGRYFTDKCQRGSRSGPKRLEWPRREKPQGGHDWLM